jgi:hypothetical protein
MDLESLAKELHGELNNNQNIATSDTEKITIKKNVN